MKDNEYKGKEMEEAGTAGTESVKKKVKYNKTEKEVSIGKGQKSIHLKNGRSSRANSPPLRPNGAFPGRKQPVGRLPVIRGLESNLVLLGSKSLRSRGAAERRGIPWPREPSVAAADLREEASEDYVALAGDSTSAQVLVAAGEVAQGAGGGKEVPPLTPDSAGTEALFKQQIQIRLQDPRAKLPAGPGRAGLGRAGPGDSRLASPRLPRPPRNSIPSASFPLPEGSWSRLRSPRLCPGLALAALTSCPPLPALPVRPSPASAPRMCAPNRNRRPAAAAAAATAAAREKQAGRRCTAAAAALPCPAPPPPPAGEGLGAGGAGARRGELSAPSARAADAASARHRPSPAARGGGTWGTGHGHLLLATHTVGQKRGAEGKKRHCPALPHPAASRRGRRRPSAPAGKVPLQSQRGAARPPPDGPAMMECGHCACAPVGGGASGESAGPSKLRVSGWPRPQTAPRGTDQGEAGRPRQRALGAADWGTRARDICFPALLAGLRAGGCPKLAPKARGRPRRSTYPGVMESLCGRLARDSWLALR
ncbi:translation initiation factor IF-2-like [Dromiciops gliroides]|uniref:translation initiation factor IF-2-like n=1 Tax=Dromiciops gliroides TaxID=33562 RepID=UPI001CC7C26E|nr:translation initiation factor IF-2-like [Dromiciops gliroides]